jgi:hypothetical protein
MSIRVFDFECPNGHVDEYFVGPGTVSLKCAHCDETAKRIITAPRVNLDPISGHFPGATMSWERRREEKMAQERKNKANHGTYGDGTWEKARGASR